MLHGVTLTMRSVRRRNGGTFPTAQVGAPAGFGQHRRTTKFRCLAEGASESARKILAGVGDLGGGDPPTPENELKRASVPVLELPTILIGIVIAYNLPNTPGGLRLSGPVL